MALQTAALLVLAQNYAGDIRRQINRRAVALSLLPKEADEGKNVAWAAQGDGAIAEFFGEGADAVNFGTDSQTSAILPWAQARSNFSVSGFARAASRTSRTPEGNIDLIARDVLDGVSALADKLNKSLYTGLSGQTPGQIVGFDEAIGLTNNTYAQIDRTVLANAFWKPYVIDPGVATALTYDQIRIDLASIYKASGSRPNLALLSPATFAALASIFDPNRFYNMKTAAADGMKITSPELEGGVGAIRFDNCNFVEDKDATDGNIYYINTSTVSVQYLPVGEPGPGGRDEMTDMVMTDGYDSIPLGIRMEALAKTGDADKIMMKLYPQLRVLRPNQCGVRKSVKFS